MAIITPECSPTYVGDRGCEGDLSPVARRLVECGLATTSSPGCCPSRAPGPRSRLLRCPLPTTRPDHSRTSLLLLLLLPHRPPWPRSAPTSAPPRSNTTLKTTHGNARTLSLTAPNTVHSQTMQATQTATTPSTRSSTSNAPPRTKTSSAATDDSQARPRLITTPSPRLTPPPHPRSPPPPRPPPRPGPQTRRRRPLRPGSARVRDPLGPAPPRHL